MGNKKYKRISACVLIFFMFAAGVVFSVCNIKAASASKIYVSVEKFTLGQGYLVEPTVMTFTEGENYAQIFNRLMIQNGYTFTYDGTFESNGSFYLRSIDNADSGVLNIPKCIQNMPPNTYSGETIYPPTNTTNMGNVEAPTLGEFAYCSQSGWYYFVNGIAPNIGFNGVKAKDGDVIRFQFTLFGLGKDLGDGDGALVLPEREAITKQLAIFNQNKGTCVAHGAQNAYKNALSIVSNMDSTVSQVNAAYQGLPTEAQIAKWKTEDAQAALIKKNTPASTTLKSVKKAGAKKAKLTWKKVSGATGYEIYMSQKKSSGYKKIKVIRKNKTVKFTKKSLKKKKTYFFKVRTYKVVGGTTYYGAYSNVKKLKIK